MNQTPQVNEEQTGTQPPKRRFDIYKIVGVLLIIIGVVMGGMMTYDIIKGPKHKISPKPKPPIYKDKRRSKHAKPKAIPARDRQKTSGEPQKVQPKLGQPVHQEPGIAFNQVRFSDKKHGYIAGDRILVSDDGGKTWKEAVAGAGGRMGLLSLDILGDKIAWASGFGGVYATHDGGATWNRFPGIERFQMVVHGLDIVDEKTVWGVGDKGKIIYTTDGGVTWEKAWEADKDWTFESVAFIDNKRGFASGFQFDKQRLRNGIILGTFDGGKTWEVVYRLAEHGDDFLVDVGFADDKVGWATGMSGCIVLTEDGGKSWRVVPEDHNAIFFRIFALTDNIVHAVGSHGAIVKSEDRGRSWRILNSGVRSTLKGIFFIDKDTGWAVGDDATLVLTNDGGATWSQVKIY